MTNGQGLKLIEPLRSLYKVRFSVFSCRFLMVTKLTCEQDEVRGMLSTEIQTTLPWVESKSSAAEHAELNCIRN